MTHFIPSASFPTQYGQSAAERKDTLTCMREHRASWVVVARKHNRSAFNGYHYTRSDYSGVRCTRCDRYWRTKAAYVDELPDAEYGVI
jgi:hypothetical protein